MRSAGVPNLSCRRPRCRRLPTPCDGFRSARGVNSTTTSFGLLLLRHRRHVCVGLKTGQSASMNCQHSTVMNYSGYSTCWFHYMRRRRSVDQETHGLAVNAALRNVPRVVTSVHLLLLTAAVKGWFPVRALTLLRQLPPRWRGILKGDLTVSSVAKNVGNFGGGALPPTGRAHNSYGAQLINSWVAARPSRAM